MYYRLFCRYWCHDCSNNRRYLNEIGISSQEVKTQYGAEEEAEEKVVENEVKEEKTKI